MRVVGIICEYNPFHHGHKYHLKHALEKTNADYSVCILSGNFVQRGEPAIINKWQRAKMAVLEGVDLVLELPVIYSISSAEMFSFGAVKYLDKLDFVTDIVFGSESGSISDLSSISSFLNNETANFKKTLHDKLSKGYSFPKARAIVIEELTDLDSNILKNSNNVLGIEYLKAAQKIDSNISFSTIERKKSNYKSQNTEGKYSSATSIRNLIANGKDFSKYMPNSSYNILKKHIEEGSYVFFDFFEDLFFYLLKSKSLNELLHYDYMNDGLAERLKKGCSETNTIKDLIEFVKTKRHTNTRINRALINLLLNIKKIDKYKLDNDLSVYYNVLAFSKKGAHLLKLLKEAEKYPIISKTANYYSLLNSNAKKLFELGLTSTNIYNIKYPNSNKQKSYSDYYMSPFILQ